MQSLKQSLKLDVLLQWLSLIKSFYLCVLIYTIDAYIQRWIWPWNGFWCYSYICYTGLTGSQLWQVVFTYLLHWANRVPALASPFKHTYLQCDRFVGCCLLWGLCNWGTDFRSVATLGPTSQLWPHLTTDCFNIHLRGYTDCKCFFPYLHISDCRCDLHHGIPACTISSHYSVLVPAFGGFGKVEDFIYILA